MSNSHSPDSEAAQGNTEISEKVLLSIARNAVLSVPGIVRHSTGFNKFTGREYPRVDVQQQGHFGVLRVDINIAVNWPSPVSVVAQVVRATVAEWLIAMTGRQISAVNVRVADVVVGESRTTIQQLQEAHRTPQLRTIVANPLQPDIAPERRGIDGYTSEPASERVRSISAPSPVAVQNVTAPEPFPIRRVSAPEPFPVRTVVPPSHVDLRPVVQPVPVDVLRVKAPTTDPIGATITIPTRPHPRPLRAVVTPTGLPLLRTVTTPHGTPLRDIPTPQGAAMKVVPTPQGLPVTIQPTFPERSYPPIPVPAEQKWGVQHD